MMRRRALLAASLTGGDFKPIIDINNYLTIEALEDGLTAKLSLNACEYCVDGDGNWKTLSASTNTESINIGQTLSFRGELIPTTSSGIGTFNISKKCNLLGNCMSMLYGDNAADEFSLSGKGYAFYKLFYNCINIVNVSSNFLPATTLAARCYEQMFSYCYKLTTAPELPATTLTNYCYSNMFEGCKSLTTAPELPATTLADSCYSLMFYGCTSLTIAPSILSAKTLGAMCYRSMFQGCTSLTIAPELPAKKLVSYCYEQMFYGCSNLNYIKMLATNISASNCLNNWVNGVATTGTFVKNKNATWNVTGVNGVPRGWTIQKV